MAVKKIADLANSNVPLFSEETLEYFRNKKDERIENSVARKNPNQDFWEAMNESLDDFANHKLDNGKTMLEVFQNLK